MPSRSIDTELWSDRRVIALSPSAKLVFVRLITGPETTPAGATRITAEVLHAYLGMTIKAARAALSELVEADLLREYEDWFWLPKFIHYQLSGPGFIVAVRRSMKGLPEALQAAIDRALVSKVGAERARQKPDKSPTGKKPTTRAKRGQTQDQTGGGTGGQKERSTRTRTRTDLERSVGSGGVRDDDEPVESAAAPPEPEPGAQSPPPEANGHAEPSRVDLDAIAAASPAVAAGLARARAGA